MRNSYEIIYVGKVVGLQLVELRYKLRNQDCNAEIAFIKCLRNEYGATNIEFECLLKFVKSLLN